MADNQDYADNGGISINLNFDPKTKERFPFRAKLARVGEAQPRKALLKVTAGGHLSGFMQNNGPEATLARKMFDSSIQQGVVPDKAANDQNVDIELSEFNGRIVAKYRFDGIMIAEKPLDLMPNQVFLYNNERHTSAYDARIADGAIDPAKQARPPRFQGFTVDQWGSLSEPAAFERVATKDKDGNDLREPRIFYSGPNADFDFVAHKERQAAAASPATGKGRKTASAARVVPDGATSIYMDL